MLWNWTTIDACFISSDWHIRSHGAFAASCVGVVLMVVALEALRRAAREYDEWIARDVGARMSSSSSSSGGDGEDVEVAAAAVTRLKFRPGVGQQAVRAGLHAATFGLAYLLMLMAMYYNGYIIICIFMGAGVGLFLFVGSARPGVVGGGCGGAAAPVGGKWGGRTIDEPTVCCG